LSRRTRALPDSAPASSLPGLRVRLRPLTDADDESISPWLSEAVAAVSGRGTERVPDLALRAALRLWDERYPPGETLAGALQGGDVIGLLRVREAATPGLIIDALSVRADRRNLGYGQEIVFALEEVRGAPSRVALAGVPRTNGLAIYFWLRTGYRPLFPVPDDLSPALDHARLWMMRQT
jgi:GNAT superfamily N-acetyltransferase